MAEPRTSSRTSSPPPRKPTPNALALELAFARYRRALRAKVARS
jgi:hypothetical protein